MKILIVEDDINSRVLLERALQNKGYIIESASNGAEALKKVTISMPDLIISDIMMPEMDGFELCRRVKTDDNLSHIPFVFYSATYVDERDERLAISLGASKFLIKPMEPDIFLKIIEDVLEQYRTHKIPLPEEPLVDLADLDRMQIEALTRKLNKKVRELEKERATIQELRHDWENIFQAIGNLTIILDREYNIISANRATVKAMGVNDEKDLIGKKCYEIFHNKNSPAENCPLQKLLVSQEFEQIEMKVEALGRIYLVSCTPVFYGSGDKREINKIIHIATDITESKRVENALRESEETYRKLFYEHVATKLLIDPETGRIVDSNEAASNFYGWSREELQEKTLFEIDITSEAETKALINNILKSKNFFSEAIHTLKNSSTRHVKIINSVVTLKGKDYIHSTVHDITKEKELEAQLFQAQKLESIGRLAGAIAHDFNNMLNVILGYGELALNKLSKNDPLYKDISEIFNAGKRSMALTSQLLAFSKKQILEPKVFNINDTLKSVQKMFERLIGEDIELIMTLKEDIPNVKADPSQIEQVIMNLAINARDAMPFGGKLIIETANIFLDDSYAQTHAEVIPGDYVMIAVTDTGYGMDKETLPHIFEPFFTTKGKEKGTGLGLATVYGIVKQSGGHIWVYSEVGKGTTFKIYLPATSAKPEPQVEERETEKVKLKAGGEHILVVEDETALQGLFEAFITNLGYRVTIAANGGEALLLVEEKGLKPDLIITDVIMPGISGPELINRLKKSQPELRVLYMSGYTDNAIVHHGVLDSGTPFIQKPFNMGELAAKIEKLLK